MNPVIQCVFYDHNGIQFEFSNRNINEKYPIIQKLNSTVLYNPRVKEYIKREIIKYFEIMKMKIQHIKIYEIQLLPI